MAYLRYKPLPDLKLLNHMLDYDSEKGVLKRKSTGKEIKSNHNFGYKRININGVNYSAHRIVWKIYYKSDPDGDIDHINGCPDDNRISNLRIASYQTNLRNRKMFKNNISGQTGVRFDQNKNKWVVRISKKFLGYFDEKEEAINHAKNFYKNENYGENHGR